MLPMILTAGNLLLGFTAIIILTLQVTLGWDSAMIGTSIWCIVLAGVLDAIDGPVARWGGRAPSVWGGEFDALADLISFGVAPSVLLVVVSSPPARWITALFGGIYVIAGAWRLARYLQEGARPQYGRFEGMPITAAGLALVALWLFENELWQGLHHLPVAWILFLVCSVLMVSRLPFEKFPELGRSDRRTIVKWRLTAGIVALLGIKPTLVGLPVALLYLAHGPLAAIAGTAAVPSADPGHDITEE
ncbi:CDP-alcohol phosphatidyltransferase family protein [Candidatus Zixiibacteriota bacterium]